MHVGSIATHENVLGLFPSIQVTSHLKRIRFVSVRSSLPWINIGVRIELTFFLFGEIVWWENLLSIYL